MQKIAEFGARGTYSSFEMTCSCHTDVADLDGTKIVIAFRSGNDLVVSCSTGTVWAFRNAFTQRIAALPIMSDLLDTRPDGDEGIGLLLVDLTGGLCTMPVPHKIDVSSRQGTRVDVAPISPLFWLLPEQRQTPDTPVNLWPGHNTAFLPVSETTPTSPPEAQGSGALSVTLRNAGQIRLILGKALYERWFAAIAALIAFEASEFSPGSTIEVLPDAAMLVISPGIASAPFTLPTMLGQLLASMSEQSLLGSPGWPCAVMLTHWSIFSIAEERGLAWHSHTQDSNWIARLGTGGEHDPEWSQLIATGNVEAARARVCGGFETAAERYLSLQPAACIGGASADTPAADLNVAFQEFTIRDGSTTPTDDPEEWRRAEIAGVSRLHDHARVMAAINFLKQNSAYPLLVKISSHSAIRDYLWDHAFEAIRVKGIPRSQLIVAFRGLDVDQAYSASMPLWTGLRELGCDLAFADIGSKPFSVAGALAAKPRYLIIEPAILWRSADRRDGILESLTWLASTLADHVVIEGVTTVNHLEAARRVGASHVAGELIGGTRRNWL